MKSASFAVVLYHLTLPNIFLGPTLARAELPEVERLPSHKELPDPLVMFSGERVTTAEQWTGLRFF
jgi:hypothetical protein